MEVRELGTGAVLHKFMFLCFTAPWGKRRWKTFYAILKGTVIYLMKEEFGPSKQASEEAISIHHSLACRAEEYNKRPHVFRLKTADWRIFLFQAENAEQMSSWITRINLVAAMFSSPPFPAAVGSKRKFNRPILPSVTSKQSEEEQLESHDAMLQSILDDLDDHQMTFPDRKWKAKDFEEYKLKQEYFEYEVSRWSLGSCGVSHIASPPPPPLLPRLSNPYCRSNRAKYPIILHHSNHLPTSRDTYLIHSASRGLGGDSRNRFETH
ncbi:PH and SEC7 domain-containing protein 1 isoform X2 [Chiloscyllium plagiosum]|uniref:PH and SEC7 domain-containing protein 1 isoform X2 n=1 Tax=Chiloscyllium plagiosum TaxID=36176 RepID=UPI001CB7B5F2|nr:PH and SEC7 domain-containing protein 1 isoform X2 [Chiloscyllium plagiosum]